MTEHSAGAEPWCFGPAGEARRRNVLANFLYHTPYHPALITSLVSINLAAVQNVPREYPFYCCCVVQVQQYYFIHVVCLRTRDTTAQVDVCCRSALSCIELERQQATRALRSTRSSGKVVASRVEYKGQRAKGLASNCNGVRGYTAFCCCTTVVQG